MHKYLKIHDMYIEFIYQFNDYFKDTIDVYQTESIHQNFYQIVVYVEDHISLPNEFIDHHIMNNRKVYETQNGKYIVTFANNHDIKHMIYHTNDYRTIRIILNSKLSKRLAEYEYALSGIMFLELAIKQGYLPVHASALTVDKYTLLLSGPSQTGKSTQTRFLQSSFANTQIINEDKPLLFIRDQVCFVTGSPWSGKDVINSNTTKEVQALFFIHQSESLAIKELSEKEKMNHIFKNTQRPFYEDLVETIAETIQNVIPNLDIYQFDCINDNLSATFLYQFMEDHYENKS